MIVFSLESTLLKAGASSKGAFSIKIAQAVGRRAGILNSMHVSGETRIQDASFFLAAKIVVVVWFSPLKMFICFCAPNFWTLSFFSWTRKMHLSASNYSMLTTQTSTIRSEQPPWRAFPAGYTRKTFATDSLILLRESVSHFLQTNLRLPSRSEDTREIWDRIHHLAVQTRHDTQQTSASVQPNLILNTRIELATKM